jgi:hypothetical protein
MIGLGTSMLHELNNLNFCAAVDSGFESTILTREFRWNVRYLTVGFSLLG